MISADLELFKEQLIPKITKIINGLIITDETSISVNGLNEVVACCLNLNNKWDCILLNSGGIELCSLYNGNVNFFVLIEKESTVKAWFSLIQEKFNKLKPPLNIYDEILED